MAQNANVVLAQPTWLPSTDMKWCSTKNELIELNMPYQEKWSIYVFSKIACNKFVYKQCHICGSDSVVPTGPALQLEK